MGTAFCVVQTRTMKTFVALALFVAAASAYTTTLQDRIVLYPHMMAKNPARGSGRIVGGQEAVPNSYPHLVFLLIDSLYVCGGNIFNNNTNSNTHTPPPATTSTTATTTSTTTATRAPPA